jgi:hypothetical protein
MESIDISYWLATRDKMQSQNCSDSTPQTLTSSDHESFSQVMAQRQASKWRRLFSLARCKARFHFLRS